MDEMAVTRFGSTNTYHQEPISIAMDEMAVTRFGSTSTYHQESISIAMDEMEVPLRVLTSRSRKYQQHLKPAADNCTIKGRYK
jgi:hypothetical protein